MRNILKLKKDVTVSFCEKSPKNHFDIIYNTIVYPKGLFGIVVKETNDERYVSGFQVTLKTLKFGNITVCKSLLH
jgi:hypothetical protein